MVKTPSTMSLPLGAAAPEFELNDVRDGASISLASFEDAKALLVMFLCAHCPFVIHVENEIARLGKDYSGSGLGIVGISANDITTHPDDRPERLAEQARRVGFDFPYCFDETQEVAKAYRAACTPDFFLFDGKRRLAYRGQLDGSRPGNDVPVTGGDLRRAIDAVLAARPVPGEQKPSLGCNIKWRPGNEPDYF
jgi:peroxiredoxin